MFELRIVPLPRLAELGESVELRELSYGELRRVMQEASGKRAGESLLGATLCVNGTPIGLEALDALPGRFAGALGAALQECLGLYGMAPPPEPSEAPSANDEGPPTPGEA